MKQRNISIPSVLQSYNSPLRNVTSNKFDGLKISHESQDYIIGNLALNEGDSPHKVINCSPDEIDYQILMKVALEAARDLADDEPLSITTGFPFSTYRMNEHSAKQFLLANNQITVDTRTYGGEEIEEKNIQIDSVEIMPELIASTLAARSPYVGINGGVFLVSLGYGTLEIGMSTDSGFIQRTFNSNSGLRYAVKSAMHKLEKNYYLGLRNEHQFDRSFKEGVITLNRKRIDLTDVRKLALQEYYKDIVLPLIKNTWTDDDFSKAKSLVLVGGGALYNSLINHFYDEFDGVLNIIIPEDPLIMASLGYALNSKNKLKKNSSLNGAVPVGIDIGNANTVVTMIQDEEPQSLGQ